MSITLYSSHGTIEVDEETGDVIKINCTDSPDDIDPYFSTTIRADLKEVEKTYGEVAKEMDILDVGLWYKDGTYSPPDQHWREEFKQYSRFGGKDYGTTKGNLVSKQKKENK